MIPHRPDFYNQKEFAPSSDTLLNEEATLSRVDRGSNVSRENEPPRQKQAYSGCEHVKSAFQDAIDRT
jgi:hypothetical protein